MLMTTRSIWKGCGYEMIWLGRVLLLMNFVFRATNLNSSYDMSDIFWKGVCGAVTNKKRDVLLLKHSANVDVLCYYYSK